MKVNQGTPTSTPTDAENLSSALNKTGKPVLRRDWFCVVILLFQMVLMASTWRLWGLPSMSSFPTVPLIAAFGKAPDTLHLILSVSLFGCCVALLIRELTHCERNPCSEQPAPRSPEDCSGDHLPKYERGFVASLTFRVRKWIARFCVIGGDFLPGFGLGSAVSGDAGGAGRERKNDLFTWGVALTAIGLVVLNQHRLQPWHWLFILIFCQKAILNERSRWLVHRVTFASIYIFAGLSRIGEHVADGAARQIVFQTFGWLGISQALRNEDLVYWSCLAMTCAEAVIGILLLARATRKAAVWMAVAMHLFLLIALGPLGLNHHPGVQIWNLFFIVATPILFSDFCMTKENAFRSSDQQVTRGLRAGKPGTATERSRDGKSADNFRAAMVLAFVVLFPLSGLFGFADNWPSWQVYSPRPEVVRVFVRNSVVDELPAEMREFLGQPAPLQDWTPLRIDQWSLSAVNAPIYPQERFGLAVAMEVGEHIPPGDIQVTIERPQLWYWRSHTVVHLTGLDAIRSAAASGAGHAGFERN